MTAAYTKVETVNQVTKGSDIVCKHWHGPLRFSVWYRLTS
ncbi:MAG: hypothetical protein QOH35_3699 [Acidobacteriaceae bacterium]|nr:hypothetical protein [Acidobacteriaceae bacterium]